jgi:hypothetical protein
MQNFLGQANHIDLYAPPSLAQVVLERFYDTTQHGLLAKLP